MKLHTHNQTITITKKNKIAVSVSNNSYTYRLRIPKMFLSSISNVTRNTRFKFIVEGNRYLIQETKEKNCSKIMSMTKDSYGLTLNKTQIPEMMLLDKIMDGLDDIKKREPIFVYLKLKINTITNERKLTFKIANKYSQNRKVKQIKENKYISFIQDNGYYVNYKRLLELLNKNNISSPQIDLITRVLSYFDKNEGEMYEKEVIVNRIENNSLFNKDFDAYKMYLSVKQELEQMGEVVWTKKNFKNYMKKYKKMPFTI